MTRKISAAATGTLRSNHYVLNRATSEYERSTLIEGTRTNLCLQSENFGTTWSAIASPTRSAAAHTSSGITLDLIGDDSAVAEEYYQQTISFTADAVKAVSIFVKEGASPPTSGSAIVITDSTAAANRLLATITWDADHAPSVAMTTGTHLYTEVLKDGVYRLYFQTTAVTAANTNVITVRPATTVAETGDIYAGGVQVENAAFPSSYIANTTGAGQRNADVLTVDLPADIAVPQAMTVYVKFVELTNPTWDQVGAVSPRILHIGTSAGSGARFIIARNATTDRYIVQHVNATGVTATATDVDPALGDLIEIRGVVLADGSVYAGIAKNGAAESVSATSVAEAFSATWSDDVMHVGSLGSSSGAASTAFLAIKIAKGEKTLAEMRALHDMAQNVLVLNAGDADAIFLDCQSGQEYEPTDIGDTERTFAGNLRVATRDQKRSWTVTTAHLEAEERDAINALIADNAVIPVSGIILGNETINAVVKATSQTLVRGTSVWIMVLKIVEV